MTLAERMAAFPRDCQVRRRGQPKIVGTVVGWSHKYNAIYVRTGISKTRQGQLGACHLWERCADEPAAMPSIEPSIEEHW